jgi:hypothetical protein
MVSFLSASRRPGRVAGIFLSLTLVGAASAAAPGSSPAVPTRPADAKALGIAASADYQEDPKVFDKLDL